MAISATRAMVMDQYQLHMVRVYTHELKREEKVTIMNITKYGAAGPE